MYIKPDLEIINFFMLYSTEHKIYHPCNANNKHLLAEQIQHLRVLKHENSLFYGNLDFRSSLKVVLSWNAHEQKSNNLGPGSGFICTWTVETYNIGHCMNWFNRKVWLKCWLCYALLTKGMGKTTIKDLVKCHRSFLNWWYLVCCSVNSYDHVETVS